MKNRFFCVVMVQLSVLCLPLQAQNAPARGGQSHRGPATVEGIWQLCTFQKGETGETEIHLAPVLKVVSGDGTYNDIIIKTTAGGCVITGSGRYTKANDSLLVFQPSKLRHLDTGAPKADSVTFRLEGPQWMLLERKPATGEEPAAERNMDAPAPAARQQSHDGKRRHPPEGCYLPEGRTPQDGSGSRTAGQRTRQETAAASHQRNGNHGRLGCRSQLDERRLNREIFNGYYAQGGAAVWLRPLFCFFWWSGPATGVRPQRLSTLSAAA